MQVNVISVYLIFFLTVIGLGIVYAKIEPLWYSVVMKVSAAMVLSSIEKQTFYEKFVRVQVITKCATLFHGNSSPSLVE